MVGFRFTWVLTFLFCISLTIPMVNPQMQGCSLQGIHLEQCLDLGINSVSNSCCRALNQAVEAGFYCLCFLLASSGPHLSTLLSLPLSNCFISLPPFTQCQASLPELHPPASQVPSLLPPAIPNKTPQPPSPKVLLAPPPPQGVQVPLNSTSNNETIAARLPSLCDNAAPYSSVFKNGNVASHNEDKAANLLYPRVLLAITLYVCIF